MRHLVFTFVGLFSMSVLAAVQHRWTCETSEISEEAVTAYHGETVELSCRMTSYGQVVPSCRGGGAWFFWQTNGMNSAWWTTNAVFGSGTVRANWTPMMDVGGDSYRFFFQVSDDRGANYRANGTLSLLGSPAGDVRYLPLPTKLIDFKDVTVLNPTNAPWEMKGGGGGGGIITNDFATTSGVREIVRAMKPVRLGAYLWEVGTEGEDFARATNRLAQVYPSYRGGGCTGIVAGNYQGRNLDWSYDRGATIVVRSPSREGKYGVLGIVEGALTDGFLESEAWTNAYWSIPFSLCDGINEKGVVIQQNVVQKDAEKSAAWRTNATGRVICFCIVRYALDRCATALEAATLIRDMNFVPGEFGFDFHYLVSDGSSSYVVEDGAVYAATETRPTDIMTNFRIGGATTFTDGLPVWATVETYGIGLERYENARTNGLDKATLDGMVGTMTDLWYTKAYETNTVPYWYTEHCRPSVGGDFTVMNAKTNHDTAAWRTDVAVWYVDYTNEHDRASASYRGGKTWQTTHTAVYDRDALSLTLFTQEDAASRRLFRLVDDGKANVVLPSKWALANVTNANGKAVTAGDVGAWSLERTNWTTNWSQRVNFTLPGDGDPEIFGYVGIGSVKYPGGYVYIDVFDGYGERANQIKITPNFIALNNGTNYSIISWKDILTQGQVQQAWSQLQANWEKPISAKGVYNYLTNQYYTSHLDDRYYTKTAADTNFLSKLTAVAEYMAKTGTYSKAEMDANFLNVTSRVERIYAGDGSKYLNGAGEIYSFEDSGHYWDLLATQPTTEHFIFVETNGVDGFYCASFIGHLNDARLKFVSSQDQWCLYVPATSQSSFREWDGTAGDTTITMDPFGTATRHSAGGSYVYADRVATTNDVASVPRITDGVNEIRADGVMFIADTSQTWTPSHSPIPETPQEGDVYFEYKFYDTAMEVHESEEFSYHPQDGWLSLGYVAMSGASNKDPDATVLAFPDGTVTRRVLKTKVATTNDVSSVAATVAQKRDKNDRTWSVSRNWSGAVIGSFESIFGQAVFDEVPTYDNEYGWTYRFNGSVEYEGILGAGEILKTSFHEGWSTRDEALVATNGFAFSSVGDGGVSRTSVSIALTSDISDVLKGRTFDFSSQAGVYAALTNVVYALGGSVTNMPGM